MAEDRPITLRQVAERLGKTYVWMSRHAKGLRTQHGFPSPIPGLGHLYDPIAIDEWLAHWRRQQANARDPQPAPAANDDEADLRAALAARAAALAQSRQRA